MTTRAIFRCLVHAFQAGFLAGSLIAAIPISANASMAGDANAVKGLIADKCSKCHAIPPYSTTGHPSLNAPPFKEIANTPKLYTEQRLRTFLRRPHYPMRGFILSKRDIDNILAFIENLADK